MTSREFWRMVGRTWDQAAALDLRQTFGIDVFDPATHDRPWWWLRMHIMGLLDGSTRLLHLMMKMTTPREDEA
jgi:hypothetical protein